MIGVSLKFNNTLFTEEYKEALRPTLRKMRLAGAESIELRTVRADSEPEKVLDAARFFWDEGFSITVHGETKIQSPETAVKEVFAPLSLLLSDLRQKKLNITIHPIVGDNAAVLTALADHIEALDLPVTVALENNRLLPDKTEGDSTALVLAAVKKANRKCIGICFDLGHYRYFVMKNHPDTPDLLPDPEFFRYVIHTHIHAMNGLRTHFPLGRYELPLEKMTAPFYRGYHGVYNLELTFKRFAEELDMETAILESVSSLKKRLPRLVFEYDDTRLCFDEWAKSALGVKKQNEGLFFGLIHSTSYLFQTNGYFWGMDLAFRAARELAEMPGKADEWLKDLKLMVITHGHRDHFEESTVRLLSPLPIEWVIPDFLLEKALSWGLDPEKIHTAKAGEKMKIGPLTLLPFRGQHFRPVTGAGVEELGYIVSSEGLPTLAFPGDVRDPAVDRLPELPKARCVFAHVWLGDKKAKESEHALAEPMAKFFLKFSDQNVYLTHLHESGRADESLWLERHAEEVKEKILALSPNTNVFIPERGEVIRLD